MLLLSCNVITGSHFCLPDNFSPVVAHTLASLALARQARCRRMSTHKQEESPAARQTSCRTLPPWSCMRVTLVAWMRAGPKVTWTCKICKLQQESNNPLAMTYCCKYAVVLYFLVLFLHTLQVLQDSGAKRRYEGLRGQSLLLTFWMITLWLPARLYAHYQKLVAKGRLLAKCGSKWKDKFTVHAEASWKKRFWWWIHSQ